MGTGGERVALAAGLPVLVSRICGCLPDFLSGVPGTVFDPLDATMIADRMAAVLAALAVAGMHGVWSRPGALSGSRKGSGGGPNCGESTDGASNGC